jgi:hypothetical protein
MPVLNTTDTVPRQDTVNQTVTQDTTTSVPIDTNVDQIITNASINQRETVKTSGPIAPDIEKFFSDYEDSFKRIEPIQSGLVKNPKQEDFGFWNTLGDMVLSASMGPVNAIENTGDFLDRNIVSLGGVSFGDNDGKLSFQDFIPKIITPTQWKEGKYSDQRNLPMFYEPKTIAGNLSEGLTRFVSGFVGPNALLKSVGVAGSLGLWSLRGVSAGAISDLTVWDPSEGRLSDMLVQFNSPVLNNAVTNYLASDPEDTEMEGRLKNVLEGMLGGTIISGAFKSAQLLTLLGIKGVKKINSTRDPKVKEQAYKDTGEAIKEVQDGNIDAPIVKKQIADGNPAINIDKLEEAIKIGKKTAKEDTESFIKSILNTKSFKSSEHVLSTIDQVSELFTAEQRAYLKDNVLRNSVAEELATIMSRDKEEILRILPQIAADANQSTVRMLATKMVLQEIAFTFRESSIKYNKLYGDNRKLWTESSKVELETLAQIIRDSVTSLKEQIRGAARTTQAGRVKVGKAGGTRLDVENYANIVKEFDGDIITIAKKISQSKTPENILDSVAKTKMQKSIEVFNSAYINSLLSGTATHEVNFLSSLYEAFIRPLEQIGGGVFRADHKTIRLGFAQYKGMLHNFKDMWSATKTAFKQSDSVLDSKMRTQDNLQIVNGRAVRPISASNLGFNGRAGTAIDWIGKFIEFPSRLMVTSDELFKQMNYRGRVYTNALENTMERGLDIYSKEGKANIKRILSEAFDENGRANIKNNPLNEKALQYAREATFTNSIKNGSYGDWGSGIDSFLRSHPSLRFLAPFVRTPTNLWRHVENRIPGWGIYTKQMQEMWSSGDRRARAEVIGRQMLGFSATTLALMYAFDNVQTKDGKPLPKLTGAGPANKDIKKIWMDLGWQPYSIAQINKDGSITYLQYNRMDPRFYMFGLVADIKENFGNINEAEAGDAFSAAFLTIYRNTIGKTYMRGMADTLDVLANPTANKISSTFGKIIGSVIPLGALRDQFQSQSYETRSFVDGIISRSSLGSVFLEPKRDILTGKPIDKVTAGLNWNPDGIISVTGLTMGPALVGKSVNVKDDPVIYELARLKVPLKQPAVKKENVDLSEIKKDGQSAYDYWIQRIGETKDSAKLTFKERLTREFNSDQYKRAQEGGEGTIGGKEYIVSKVYDQFKAYAYQDMINKYPEVKKAIDQSLTQKSKLMQLKPNMAEQKKSLQ